MVFEDVADALALAAARGMKRVRAGDPTGSSIRAHGLARDEDKLGRRRRGRRLGGEGGLSGHGLGLGDRLAHGDVDGRQGRGSLGDGRCDAEA